MKKSGGETLDEFRLFYEEVSSPGWSDEKKDKNQLVKNRATKPVLDNDFLFRHRHPILYRLRDFWRGGLVRIAHISNKLGRLRKRG